MEAHASSSDVLLQRPWLPVSISGCQLLAKSSFGDTSYHVLLTDMHSVWEEHIDSAAIQERAQELNKRLRAPVKAFLSHLRKVVQPCLSGGHERADGEAQISLMRREEGDISMRLKSELAGLPFYWEFHCSVAPVTVVCAQLVRPLLAMSHLLQRQVEQLGGLLVRKDAEIQDYRENGATLTRERLQTDVFEEQTYGEDFMAKVRGHTLTHTQQPPIWACFCPPALETVQLRYAGVMESYAGLTVPALCSAFVASASLTHQTPQKKKTRSAAVDQSLLTCGKFLRAAMRPPPD
uniref:Non-homologous end-joining factor 1 n=1 Tax=Mola mola TaxID=94237 RepID=A0A3Q4AGA3_MOLML